MMISEVCEEIGVVLWVWLTNQGMVREVSPLGVHYPADLKSPSV